MILTNAQLIKKMNADGCSLIGLYLVPFEYLCAGFVEGTYTLKVWGYYPYKITVMKFSRGGKIRLECKLINNLGTTYEHNSFLTDGQSCFRSMDQYNDYYDTEQEAIHECHLRNRGKMGLPAGGAILI